MPAATAPVVWTIVVAAGAGSRFGGDKLSAEIADGTTVLDASIATARAESAGVVVVRPPGDPAIALDHGPDLRYVAGGTTRSASVRSGLDAVPGDAHLILVHDAARPLADAALFARVIAALESGADAVVPGVPVSDTIRSVDGGVIDRARLRAVQTPQGFRADVLRRAHEAEGEATDDAGLAELVGAVVVVVDGDVRNLKITSPSDLAVARAMFDDERQETMRIGQGFDSHPYGDDAAKPMVLGGVRFDTVHSLRGHSDSDVIAHAVTDALLGPAGLGDIGEWFPDDDPAFAGVDSMELLQRIVDELHTLGLDVVNVDCSVVAEVPKLAPERDAMQDRLSAVVGAPVTVKGKRPEGLGAIDGIACWAVALIRERGER